jgi:ribosome-binding protein aMBF1 (putative translation factor)
MAHKANTFGNQIRRAVVASGIGLNDLARRIEIDKDVMSRFVNRKGFLPERALNLLAELLKLRVITEVDDETEEE